MGLLDDIFGIGDDDDKNTPTPTPGPIIPTFPISLPGITLGQPPSRPTPPAPSSPSAVSSPPLSPSAPTSPSAPPSPPSVPATSPPPTTPPPEAPSPPSLSDSIQTQTQVVVVSGSGSQSAANNAASTQRSVSFLENKPLSGAVFGLVGLVGLVLIFTIATFFLRRRKRNRLHDDAMSFDPGLVAAADRMDQEKGRHSSHPSLGSQGAGVGGGYSNYAASLPPQQHADFYPHQPGPIDYYGQQQQAYGAQQTDYYGARQPNYAYAPPMSDSSHDHGSWGQQAPAPVPTPTPPPKDQQPLARKNSIPRVPVPPIAAPLPDEFGSSEAERRRSAEETEFWARTLKVANE